MFFLSVLFVNVTEARDISSQEKGIYVSDLVSITDSLNKLDLGEYDSNGITGIATAGFAVIFNTFFVQDKSIYYSDYAYIRPLTRASPTLFI